VAQTYAQLGSPATNAADASTRLPERRTAVIQALACEDDYAFFLKVQSGTTSEDVLGATIAKVAYLLDKNDGQPFPDLCAGSGQLSRDDVANIVKNTDDNNLFYYSKLPDSCPDLVVPQVNGGINKVPDLECRANKHFTDVDQVIDAEWTPIGNLHLEEANQKIADLFGPACRNTVSHIGEIPVEPAISPKGAISYAVSKECIRSQINVALRSMSKYGQPGTSNAPCNITGKTKGEWDVKVRDLTRIYYMTGDEGILDIDVRDHVFNDLLSLRGALGESSYSLLQCGDQEDSTGSPQDTADASSDGADFAHDVGDGGSWLLKRLALLALFALALLTLGAAAAPLSIVTPLLAAAGEAGIAITAPLLATALVFGRFPETENHRFMIETSRYLANQVVIDSVTPDAGAEVAEYQSEIKAWLMGEFRRILSNDFNEFNARPYQRYSIVAILNIYDFADDPQLKLAAQMVLDYAGAKFAVGSYQARRLVPYRRLIEELGRLAGFGPPDTPVHELLDFGPGSDYLASFMLYYSGETSQLATRDASASALEYRTDLSGLYEMIYPASSDYVPEAIVLDLVLNKKPPSGQQAYLQTIHHAGYERYSGASGFLITAGGVRTGPSGQFSIPLPIDTYRATDLGGAMPTTLMLGNVSTAFDSSASYGHRASRKATSFVRIDGIPRTERTRFDDDDTTSWTSDGNMCVWRGFACGRNVRLPEELTTVAKDHHSPCIVSSQSNGWSFLDTSGEGCTDEYRAAPRTFVAIFRDCHTADCNDNTGIFEAVAASAGDDFSLFQSNVKGSNPSFDLPGDHRTYTTSTGHVLKYEIGDTSRVTYVDNAAEPSLDALPLASGDFISASGGGEVTISRGRDKMRMDLSNTKNPTREFE
jgi:hypothetical protein